jgi:hypothetical protein
MSVISLLLELSTAHVILVIMFFGYFILCCLLKIKSVNTVHNHDHINLQINKIRRY